MKKYLVPILKCGLAVAIIGWLLWNIDPQQWKQLRSRSIDWETMVAAFVCCLGAVCLTFVRWRMLVRALGIPFGLRDAFRLGFLGFLLNFVSVGLVGGDLFKAVFIARQCPGRRPEAVATVLVDRVFGLYALLVVTSLAILGSDVARASGAVKTICTFTLLATLLGGCGIGLLFVPQMTGPRVLKLVARLPLVGTIAAKLVGAVALYRSRPGILLACGFLSLIVHSTIAVGVFLAAKSIYPDAPPLRDHLVIVPLSLVAGALPITPAGLGAFEVAMEQLYSLIPSKSFPGDGLIVALAYRLMTIVIAAVGGVYYAIGRREIDEVLEDAAHPNRDHNPAEEHSRSLDSSANQQDAFALNAASMQTVVHHDRTES